MNIHNHSIWPPPSAAGVNGFANAAGHGAVLQQSACAALLITEGRSQRDAVLAINNLMDKE